MWSWTNYGHIAFEYIEKLRQLIQTGSSHEASYGGYPRIITSGLREPVVAFLMQFHAAEFIHIESLAIQAESRLSEKHRAG